MTQQSLKSELEEIMRSLREGHITEIQALVLQITLVNKHVDEVVGGTMQWDTFIEENCTREGKVLDITYSSELNKYLSAVAIGMVLGIQRKRATQ